MKYQEKIITLWTSFLLGTLFHTQLGLMPLFHGQDIAHSHDTGDISWILWLMLLFFVVPIFAMIATVFFNSKRLKTGHFALTIVYSILNFIHLTADLLVTPIAWYQIVLMGIVFVIGLLLNVVAFGWMKYEVKSKKLSHQNL